MRDGLGRFIKGHKPLSDKGRFKKGHKSSKETLEKLRLSRIGNKSTLGRRGKNANHWKGGLTKKYKLLRSRIEWKLWREKVFLRDDYTCQACGERGLDIQADHVLPFSLYPDLRFELLNGRTLCVECHKKTDTYQNNIIKYKKQNEVFTF